MLLVERALDAGLPAVQLREKDLPGRALLGLAERLRAATAARGARLYVNDRIDVALAVGADGVQLGEASLPVAAARSLLPATTAVFESTHSVAAARASVADVVVFGPIYDTPSKRPFGVPQGERRLADAALACPVPVLAIGGIDAATAPRCRAAGAAGVAVIRAILAADDPARATRELRPG